MDARQEIIAKLRLAIANRKVNFLIAIPTYNEVDNILELIRRIDARVLAPREILVIDDGSPDGTADAVRTQAKNIPGVHIYKRAGKLGLGSAYLAAFSIAIDAGFPYVITMDADLSHDPVVINAMISIAPLNDLVIGSRYCDGGSIPNFELWRRCMSKGGNFLAKMLLGVKARDCTSGFRCYRTQVLKALKVEGNIKSRQYIFLVEILLWLSINQCRIDEVPIEFNQRTMGKTKVSPSEYWHALERIFDLCIKVRLFKHKILD